MDKYSIVVTPNAIIQINEIASYISKVLLNPKAALDFLDSIKEKTSKLVLFPYAYSLTNEQPWNRVGIRKILLKSFVIYYVVKEDTKQVFIIAVINNRRNQLEQMKNLVI